MSVDEFSIARAKRQNAETAPAVAAARWEDVAHALDENISAFRGKGATDRFDAYRVYRASDPKVLAALLALAVERLAQR